MAEIVDGLTEEIAAIGLINGDLGHRKVSLRQLRSSRVHADENLSYRLDVEILGQVDDTDVVVDDLAEPFQGRKHLVLVHAGIRLGVPLRDLEQLRVRREDGDHVVNPCRILADGRICYLEPPFLRMERDANANRFVVFGQYLPTEQSCHERCHSLLTVDQDAFTRRRGAVLELDGRIAPRDEVADRIALIERVE